MKAYGGSTGVAPLVLNAGNKRTCVANFIPRSLYAHERDTEAELAREAVWMIWRREEISSRCRDWNTGPFSP